jgi:hypothetical protein
MPPANEKSGSKTTVSPPAVPAAPSEKRGSEPLSSVVSLLLYSCGNGARSTALGVFFVEGGGQGAATDGGPRGATAAGGGSAGDGDLPPLARALLGRGRVLIEQLGDERVELAVDLGGSGGSGLRDSPHHWQLHAIYAERLEHAQRSRDGPRVAHRTTVGVHHDASPTRRGTAGAPFTHGISAVYTSATIEVVTSSPSSARRWSRRARQRAWRWRCGTGKKGTKRRATEPRLLLALHHGTSRGVASVEDRGRFFGGR